MHIGGLLFYDFHKADIFYRSSRDFSYERLRSTIRTCLLLLNLLLGLTVTLFAHAADERSHQVITFIPDATGANLHYQLYCGPNLGKTLMMTLELSKKQPEISQDEFDPTLLSLLGKRPWLEVRCADILELSKENKNLPEEFSDQNKWDHLRLFRELTLNPIERHQLFREPRVGDTAQATWLDLQLLPPGRKISGWTPNPETTQHNQSELLALTYVYRLNWPKNSSLEKGLTITVDTNLKVFTSNSVFRWRAPNDLTLIADDLLLNQGDIDPSNFLLSPPSNEFKLRRGAFHLTSKVDLPSDL